MESSGTRGRHELPGILAILATGTVMGGLLIGIETVGGDPDRIYRALKVELAESLRAGRIPLWSDRFGVGVPLVAESHVAAFYPPNQILYRLFDVSTAYRLAMWLHYVALTAATYLYSRRLGILPWGSALASLGFTFCGFQMIHATHEPFYHAMPYLPLALWMSEGYLESGKPGLLAGLALGLGLQLCVGHFQIQMWTAGLVLLTGVWRTVERRGSWTRLLAMSLAVAWGALIAAVQLNLTWRLASLVGQTKRSIADLAFYSYPPAHWVELVMPRFFLELPDKGENTYWYDQLTTGWEACFYVGTIPMILAIIGFVPGRRSGAKTGLWRLVVPTSFVLATMVQWWPAGYEKVLGIPGLGYFRCPARYTLLTSLGLLLVAGESLDRLISATRFRFGAVLATAFGATAVGFGAWWALRSDHKALADQGLALRMGLGSSAWIIGVVAVSAWRRRRLGSWILVLLTLGELGSLYYSGPTRWGWSIPMPESSPILVELAKSPGTGRVGGNVDNLPIRAGLAAASPYLGFVLPTADQLLKNAQNRTGPSTTPQATRWLRRMGMTHGIWDKPVLLAEGERLETRSDPGLDQIAYTRSGSTEKRVWRIIRYPDPLPFARVATRARTAASDARIIEYLSENDAENEAIFLASEVPPEPPGPRARSARVVSWDSGANLAVVEHDGACDLVLSRTYDPGWLVSIGGTPETRASRANGGFLAVRVPGAGVSRVSFRYDPEGYRPSGVLSLVSFCAALAFIVPPALRRVRPSSK